MILYLDGTQRTDSGETVPLRLGWTTRPTANRLLPGGALLRAPLVSARAVDSTGDALSESIIVRVSMPLAAHEQIHAVSWAGFVDITVHVRDDPPRPFDAPSPAILG